MSVQTNVANSSLALKWLLVATCFVAGCSEPPPPPGSSSPQESSESSRAASTPQSPQLNLTVGFVFGDTQKFANPDAATIEKHVRATDWKNAQQRPLVHLARTDGSGPTAVKVQGTMGTPNEDGAFRAIVISMEGDRIALAAESPPFQSPDEAIEILLLLRNDVQELKNRAAQWKGSSQ